MEPPIEQQNNNTLRYIIVGIIVLLVVGGIGVYFYMMNATSSANNTTEQNNAAKPAEGERQMPITQAMAQENEDPDVTPSPTPLPPFDPASFDETQPWMDVTLENEGTEVAVNEEFAVLVNGYSDGANIDGYDVLFSYDPEKVEVLAVESLVEGFNIQEFIRNNFVSVTGYKRLDVDAETPFDNTPLLRITLAARDTGEIELGVLPAKGPETSKFTDADVNVIKPQVKPLMLEIN